MGADVVGYWSLNNGLETMHAFANIESRIGDNLSLFATANATMESWGGKAGIKWEW